MPDPLKHAPFPMVLGFLDEQGELHDPGVKGLCVYCGQPMHQIDSPYRGLLLANPEKYAKTLTLPRDGATRRCFFYRYHIGCWDRASVTDREAVFNYLSRSIRHSSK